jgi:S1-C subfamily serine protease
MVRSASASIAIVLATFQYSASANDIVLLDFTSPTCGPCQQMAPAIQGLIDAGFPIQKIDVMRDPQTAARYKVPRVPTLIMLVEGQVFDRAEGGMSGQRVESMFQRAKAELERRNQDRIRTQSPDRLPTTQYSAPAAQAAQAAPPSAPWPASGRASEPWVGAGASSPLARSEAPRESSAEAATAIDTRVAKLIAATVRLRVDDEQFRSFGTGTIIDARQGEALVITCGHLFRENKGQGPLSVEMFEPTPNGPRAVGKVPGQVISYDLERDVALVAIRPGRAVTVAPIAPPRAIVDRGDRVINVGCSNGQDPTAISSRVTSLDRYQGPPNIEASVAPVEGRSGGGLFNEQGQLIGVCFAADHEGNEGLYAASKAIHDELNVRGLSDVYMPRDLLAQSAAPAGGPIVRGQDPGENVVPVANRELARPKRELPPPADLAPTVVGLNSPAPAPAGLNQVEQAAWDEIMRRAATSEVICIIRPKQPGGTSEVITLNDVSPEFARALASRRQQPASTTR